MQIIFFLVLREWPKKVSATFNLINFLLVRILKGLFVSNSSKIKMDFACTFQTMNINYQSKLYCRGR